MGFFAQGTEKGAQNCFVNWFVLVHETVAPRVAPKQRPDEFVVLRRYRSGDALTRHVQLVPHVLPHQGECNEVAKTRSLWGHESISAWKPSPKKSYKMETTPNCAVTDVCSCTEENTYYRLNQSFKCAHVYWKTRVASASRVC